LPEYYLIPLKKIKIKSYSEFQFQITDQELEIVEKLKDLILYNIPDCKEKISFNVPFYSRFRSICFIWPASILWGEKQTYKGVRLGFSYGCYFWDDHNFLDKKNRKQMASHDFNSISEIKENVILDLLQQAIAVDDDFRKGKSQ
jgi:hypothetical protein